MEKRPLKSRKGILFSFFTILIASNSFAQQDVSFVINSDANKEIYGDRTPNFKVYHGTKKEIDYHPYIDGQVNTNEYNLLLERMKEYKPAYDEYKKKVSTDSIFKADLKTICEKINLYLSSNEKSDIKEQYLIQAQSIANSHKLEITGDNTSFFAKKLNDYGQTKNEAKTFKLYDGKKVGSKKDIEFYKSEIEKIKVPDIKVSHEAKNYIELLEKEKKIQKTEPGKALSSETLKRTSFIIDNEIEITSLSGEFQELPNKYMLALRDIENKFVKDELTNDTKGYYNTGGLTKEYSLIKKTNSDDYYYIMSDDYLSTLIFKQKVNELLSMVHKLGYKEYKEGQDLYIKSKTSEIRLDVRIYNELKKNPNYISTLDSDQAKITALVNQTIPHSKTLDKYLSQYNIQRRNLSTATINSWRTATTEAQKLLNQINKLSEKYDGNYSFTLLNKSNTLDIFLDNLNASKGMLGM